ncbi:hypothetical protein OF855_30710 [Mycolicibacterium fortuitum]|uniref:hypothetical protein n=1 Tax=Mycolicibacterium fortuitum TaxID=1766 RepID=UPI0022BA2C14|nr:hypothetical protein [Mycolicibacterium fortuitum]WAY19532.1 hypothetical protein OF855_30710 [Mycolicibacterium fortuitum]
MQRIATVVLAALLVAMPISGCRAQPASTPDTGSSTPVPRPSGVSEPQFPRFEDFTEVPASDYTRPYEGAFFSTPSGLACSVSSDRFVCRGDIRNAPGGANGVGLRSDGSVWFLKVADPGPQPRPPVLQPGSRLSVGDVDCVVGPDALTACRARRTSPVGFVLRAGSAALTPVSRLPAGFPDPRQYVFDSTKVYTRHGGGKNITEYFAVDGDLRCEITSFSGVRAICRGPMPGRTENVVSLNISELAWGYSDTALGPEYADPLPHLDQGRAVSSRDPSGWCMALYGGGVACSDDGGHGFVITSTESWSFP